MTNSTEMICRCCGSRQAVEPLVIVGPMTTRRTLKITHQQHQAAKDRLRQLWRSEYRWMRPVADTFGRTFRRASGLRNGLWEFEEAHQWMLLKALLRTAGRRQWMSR